MVITDIGEWQALFVSEISWFKHLLKLKHNNFFLLPKVVLFLVQSVMSDIHGSSQRACPQSTIITYKKAVIKLINILLIVTPNFYL